MEPRSVQFVVSACGGGLMAGIPETQVLRVCTDSRRVQPGDLFFALGGDQFDGHDFIPEAIRKSAAAVVAASNKLPSESGQSCIIAVDDTRAALGRLAAAYRNQFTLPVIAVAGSNGKTTAKELI